MNHHEELTNDNEFADETFELQVLPGTYLVNSPEYSLSVSPTSMATSTDTIEMREAADGFFYTYDEFVDFYGYPRGHDNWALADPRGPQQVWVSLVVWPDQLMSERLWPSEFVTVRVGVRYPLEGTPSASEDEQSPLPSPIVLDSPQSPTTL